MKGLLLRQAANRPVNSIGGYKANGLFSKELRAGTHPLPRGGTDLTITAAVLFQAKELTEHVRGD